MRLGAAFVPIRKKGKLPGECVTASYEKEYGIVSICAVYRGIGADLGAQGFVRDAI